MGRRGIMGRRDNRDRRGLRGVTSLFLRHCRYENLKESYDIFMAVFFFCLERFLGGRLGLRW